MKNYLNKLFNNSLLTLLFFKSIFFLINQEASVFFLNNILYILLFLFFLKNIKFIYKEKNTLFLFLSFILVFIFINVYSFISSSDSIFSFDERSNTENKKIAIESNLVYESEFVSKLNNLGSISVPLEIDSAENAILDGEINKIKIKFSIRKDGDEESFYTNVYDIILDNNVFIFPFGFPKQIDSKNIKYIVNLSVEQSPYKIYFKLKNGSDFVSVFPRYVYSKNDLFNFKEISPFFYEKYANYLNTKLFYSFNITMFYCFSLIFFKKIFKKKQLANILLYSISIILIFLINIENNYISYSEFFDQLLSQKNLIFLFALLTLLFSNFKIRQHKINKTNAVNKYFLFLLFFLAIILRTHNLGSGSYVTDEGSTAKYSYAINKNLTPCLDEICYLRGLPYLYFTSLITAIFSVNELTVRLSGLIFSLAGFFIFYLVLKDLNFNKKTIYLSLFLIMFSDWSLEFSRYARMYSALFFFVIATFYFYIKTFFKKKNKYLAPLFISSFLAIITHQFGMLLLYLIIGPIITGNIKDFSSKKHLAYSIFIFITVFVLLIKFPGITYSNKYLGYNDVFRDSTANVDNFWFLKRLQSPNLSIIYDIYNYLPLVLVMLIYFLYKKCINLNFSQKNLIHGFIYFSIFIILIYDSQFETKYLWWMLPFAYIVVSEELELLFKDNKIIGFLSFITIFFPSFIGSYQILERNFGSNLSRNLLISPTSTEDYSVDDKTPVLYVINHMKNKDIVITDYWMHDIYFETLNESKSNYFISEWSGKEFLIKFPQYKLIFEGDAVKQTINGPIFINSLNEFIELINNHNRVWFVSSADYIGRRHEHISIPEISKYIHHSKINPVYTPQFH
ncbi:MAG: hypothetical protein US20_C0008G0024 [Candidatus Pacebacteria bacterium GW2011_GWF1_36_5]|nr:MAG: hypothetical protein US20_C0008G0024 [Candidatus Pacebacteria bacterium GW2011_GWF1_36_5]